ncbi:MAG: aminotransferase class I/II-fold pyridoxal phosphate-dependent enzyme [Polyangiaceae bacterium]|nr:aminotransferase class I/II-fold pyridoxal phosphate-dependent enzyme [Polyangiaceae bacterium]
MKVPFIDLKRVAGLVHAQALEAWQRVAERTEFVGGPTVGALEAALAGKLGVRHAIGCSSGTDAILIGLQALGVGPGSKVALPDLTFWATYEAVAQLGATPVLVDVDEDLQLDLDELRRAHDAHRLDAVVLVHLMGWASARLGEIRAFCQERGLALVEDGAQAYGVEVAGAPVFAGARLSTLSFYPAKVIGGCMDGGAILTDDEALAGLVRKLCNHGRATHYSYSHVGWNSRMGGLQAAWLLAMLGHADEIVRTRRADEARFRERLAEVAPLARAYGPPAGVAGNGYLSVFALERAEHEAVARRLGELGVGVGRVYPETLSQQEPARQAPRASDLERSRDFCRRVVDLPLFYGMTAEEHAHVCQSFATVLRAESER